MNVYALFIMRFTTGLILPTHCSLHTSTCTQTHTLPHMLIDPITTTLLPAALHLSFHGNCTPLPSFFKPFIKRVSTIATRPYWSISALELIKKRNTKHQDLFHYPLLILLGLFLSNALLLDACQCLILLKLLWIFDQTGHLIWTKLHHFNVTFDFYSSVCVSDMWNGVHLLPAQAN